MLDGVLQSKATCVAVGAGEGVETVCISREIVATNVLCGKVGRGDGELGGDSMFCIKLQAVRSKNTAVETTLEIFMRVMLP